jgi:PAS domain S-box-containing protein
MERGMAGAVVRKGVSRWIGLLPVLVLVVSAALLAGWWRDLEHARERAIEASFQASARRVATKIAERLDTYDTILRGVAGLFAASDEVTRAEFRRYVGELELARAYPGVQGVGFAQLISPGRLPGHVAHMRAEGFPDYDVRPSGDRPLLSSIVLLEPFTGRNLRAFGFDMFSESVRREAMEAARDRGDVATSGRVRLVQETDEDVQPGFLTFHPIFPGGIDPGTVEERRKAIVGWAYSPMRAGDALRGILAGETLPYRLEIFDGAGTDPETLLFESGPTVVDAHLTYLVPLAVNQRSWTLRFTAGPAYVAALWPRSPLLEPAGMVLVTVLLTGLAAALVASYRSRERAMELARALSESEARWRTTFEQAPVGIFTVDAQDRLLQVNRRYCELTGYAREELVGTSRRRIVHPEDLADDARVAARVRSGERDIGTLERRGVRRDGSVFWVDITFSLEPASSGVPGGLIGVADDVTARHEAEDRFREIAERSVLGILILQDDRVVYANPTASAILGRALPVPETTGDWLIATVVHPDDRALVMEDRERELADLAALPPLLAYRIVRPDGSVRLVERRVQVTRHGGRRATLMTLLDVTERERTSEELRKAQRLESLGLVAGGIAHDFNNILTAVFGHVDLARGQVAPGGPAEAELEVALSALARARDLTRQLLTFATGGAPTLQLLDVGRLLAEAARLALGGSEIRARIDVEAGLPPVEADEGQMSQILNNLLVNARQATEGPGEVTLRARRRAVAAGELADLPAGDYVEIAIADHGHGIPPEVLPRVFDPFFTTRPTGTGLGLATAFSIARRHGGHVGIESAPGKGTTVTVQLPAARGAVAEAAPSTAAPPPPRPLKVLVMDDEPLVLKVGVKYLRRLGFEVETAADGAAAVEAHRRARDDGRPFDLVVLDLTVPGGMGGAQAVARMREVDPGVVAIACSGYFDAAVMAEPARFGFAGVLAKPYLAADLEQVLHAVRPRVK